MTTVRDHVVARLAELKKNQDAHVEQFANFRTAVVQGKEKLLRDAGVLDAFRVLEESEHRERLRTQARLDQLTAVRHELEKVLALLPEAGPKVVSIAALDPDTRIRVEGLVQPTLDYLFEQNVKVVDLSGKPFDTRWESRVSGG